MQTIAYRIAAKTDTGLVRTNNEDNLCVVSNLDKEGSTWINNDICQLGQKGALLVVADGMGGLNAGEVASEIAVSVIKECFTEKMSDTILSSNESIVRFMNNAIVTADHAIKSEGKRRPETRGMGTTIVIAWLYNGMLFCSWCGDSRAYIFNPSKGLIQISKDHSYVQDLVDKGIVKPEDAFDFPDSNVITRCLSHSTMAAEPENLSSPYIVSEGDIVMLCTDGLCGMIRDQEIANVMGNHTNNMTECIDALIDAAKKAAGADNITVCLCQILSIPKGIGRTNTAEITLDDKTSAFTNGVIEKKKNKSLRKSKINIISAFLALLIVAIAIVAVLDPFRWRTPRTTIAEDSTIKKKQPTDTVISITPQKETKGEEKSNVVQPVQNNSATNNILPKTTTSREDLTKVEKTKQEIKVEQSLPQQVQQKPIVQPQETAKEQSVTTNTNPTTTDTNTVKTTVSQNTPTKKEDSITVNKTETKKVNQKTEKTKKRKRRK